MKQLAVIVGLLIFFYFGAYYATAYAVEHLVGGQTYGETRGVK